MGDVPSSFPSSGLPAGAWTSLDFSEMITYISKACGSDLLLQLTASTSTAASRSKVESPTTSFSNGSSKIDAMPNVPDQDFGEDGQTEYRHAGKEAKQSKVEKESKFESLARDLLLELKGMKDSVTTMEAKHGMQIEAIHDSYKKVLSLRFTDDKSKADTMRVAMDGKVDIKAIKRFSTKEIENLVYKFEENLELMGLLDVAEGSRAGSIEEEKRLKRAILRWVSDDERIMTSMRTKMGTASTGSDAYEHVCVYFVKPMVGDG